MREIIQEAQGEPQPPVAGQPPWCVCGGCSERHNLPENCCGNSPQLCLTKSESFRVFCLNEDNVELARRIHVGILAANNLVADPNKTFRFYAYRQFIYWKRGRLGANNRCALPSCCVWEIRRQWPDPDNFYIDFLPSSLSVMI